MFHDLLRKKPIRHIDPTSHLHRSLNAIDLILMGIGAIIGAGVFVLTGVAAATKAGPAIVVSYMIAGFASMFAAFAYAELAASIGGTGSAYSYAYAGFGEFIAWVIGWDLLLEYSVAVSTVAIGWSGYVKNLLTAIHIDLPIALTTIPTEGGWINLPAILIIVLLAAILSIGVRASARFNAVIVCIKLAAIAIFIGVAATQVHLENWATFSPFGWEGIMQGAALVFFAYIGFDALSTAVAETVNPQRNVPIGIIGSLIICTLIYIIVSALLTGIVPYSTLNVPSPVANALLSLGFRMAAGFISVGAIAGLTTVMLVMYYGLTRICLAMAQDGLLPSPIAMVNPHTYTPIPTIILTGIIMASIAAGFVPINRAAELVNIGTLAAFTFVCSGALILRIRYPELPRPFKTPLFPLLPILGIISCLYLMINLPIFTWVRFIVWFLIGLVVYFSYSRQHSRLKKEKQVQSIQ